jgi:hypothetical protein
MNTRGVAYWTTTAMLAFVLCSGGLGELTQQWGTLETVTILGYPVYFLTIIGAWKIVGAIVLLVPGLPRLKEWALRRHRVQHDRRGRIPRLCRRLRPYAFHILVTLGLALLALASRALLPQSPSVVVPERLCERARTVMPAT